MPEPVTVNYPVRLDLARYDRVPILRTGQYRPRGVQGPWEVTEEFLDSLVASYDPHFYPAVLNTDHVSWAGPGLGVIIKLYRDGDTLYADLVNVDPLLAWQLDAGQWPKRSIEWWQESVHGRPFYDREDKPNYLMRLGLLGQDSPAVPDLGPFPPRATDQIEDLEPAIIEYPLAARDLCGQGLTLTYEEVPMDPKAPKAAKAPGKAPPEADSIADDAEQAETVDQLKAENADLKAQLAETTEQVQASENDSVAQIRATNEELRAQLTTMQQQVEGKARTDRLDGLEHELKAAGYITPGNRDELRARLERAYDADHALSAAAAPAEGDQAASLLSDVIATIKAGRPQYTPGRVSPSGASQPQASLSQDESDVCAALGLTTDEYRGMTAAEKQPSAEQVLASLAELLSTKTAGGGA